MAEFTTASMSDRKRKILDHVAKSSGDLITPKPDVLTPDRKKQIMDHLSRTKG